MSEQNSNKKFASYNQDDNYIVCPSGFKYYLSFSGRIPFYILIDDDLNATDIKLYAIIEGLCFSFKGPNKHNYVSNNDLCFLLGLNEKSTAYERSVKKLKDKNLIKREKKTITEKGRTFKAWCWSVEFGNFYTLINCDSHQVPHQQWDTENKYPTSDGGAVPHQEWDQISVNEISKENITFRNIKESENNNIDEVQEVIEKAQESLEATKTNLPVKVGKVKKTKYQETNYPIANKPKGLVALQQLNTLNISNEILEKLIDLRKKKKASNDYHALEAVYGELVILNNQGYDLNRAIGVYANNRWAGFNAQWIINAMYKDNKKPSQDRHAHDWSTDWIKGCDIPELTKD